VEYRRLGDSGLMVPVLGFGTATFGGGNEFFRAWGTTDVGQARRLVAMCIDAGAAFFDTSNAYSSGMAEEILGQALAGRSEDVLIATKATLPVGTGPRAGGSSRRHLIRAVEASLRRLGVDTIDVLYMHAFDPLTPVEEVTMALDHLVSSGKVHYVGASNFPGWALMKSLAVSNQYGRARYIAHQVQYSLAHRDYEHELRPLGEDQKVGAVVWSPLAGGALSGKFTRGRPMPKDSRRYRLGSAAATLDDRLHLVLDTLAEISSETGRSIAQVALNWLLGRPTVCSLVLGARTEEQLQDNLGATGWSMTPEQSDRLDKASHQPLPYPYDQVELFAALRHSG
jgi:aryl-alcohol dehydrogenase-like predicted oxidoreductase